MVLGFFNLILVVHIRVSTGSRTRLIWAYRGPRRGRVHRHIRWQTPSQGHILGREPRDGACPARLPQGLSRCQTLAQATTQPMDPNVVALRALAEPGRVRTYPGERARAAS